eukprot:g3090.t1
MKATAKQNVGRWESATDPSTGKRYWYDPKTGDSIHVNPCESTSGKYKPSVPGLPTPHLRDKFEEIANGANTLNKKQVGKLAAVLGEKFHRPFFGDSELDVAFKEMDSAGNQRITFADFLAWHRRCHPHTVEEVELQIKFLFDKFDKNEDGYLSGDEVLRVCHEMGHHLRANSLFRKGNLSEALAEMEPNNSGKVTYEQFLWWHQQNHSEMHGGLSKVIHLNHPTLMRQTSPCELHIMKLFHQLDKDKNGTLSRTELLTLFKHLGDQKNQKDRVDELYMNLNVDEDGRITFDEFTTWHKGKYPELHLHLADIDEELSDSHKWPEAFLRMKKARSFGAFKALYFQFEPMLLVLNIFNKNPKQMSGLKKVRVIDFSLETAIQMKHLTIEIACVRDSGLSLRFDDKDECKLWFNSLKEMIKRAEKKRRPLQKVSANLSYGSFHFNEDEKVDVSTQKKEEKDTRTV